MTQKHSLTPAPQFKPLPKHPLLPLSIILYKDVGKNVKYGFTLGGDTVRGPDVLVHIPGNTPFVAGPGANSVPEREDLPVVFSLFEVVAARVSEPAPYHAQLRASVAYLMNNVDALAEMLAEWVGEKAQKAAAAAAQAADAQAAPPAAPQAAPPSTKKA